jgi:hypothetical protein
VAEEGTAQLVLAMPTSPSCRCSRAERETFMGKVTIGVDPHKLSATIEALDGHENA